MTHIENYRPGPIICLRPSTEVTKIDNIYSVNRDLFSPTPTTVKRLIASLNQALVGVPTGIPDIDSVIPPLNCSFNRIAQLKLSDCEKEAVDRNCNILGGTFLQFVASFGVELGQTLGRANVEPNDTEFLRTLYPDLEDFFQSPNSVPEERKDFAQGVIYNNTGNFLIVTINGEPRSFTDEFFAQLVLLKRIYRYYVACTIPWNRNTVRDNVVHVPENLDKSNRHLKLFIERFT